MRGYDEGDERAREERRPAAASHHAQTSGSADQVLNCRPAHRRGNLVTWCYRRRPMTGDGDAR
jgi:hypothetical protein